MKHGLIITNQILGHNEFKITRFFEECKALDFDLTVFTNDGTLAFINNDGDTVINLPKADFVIYLDKDIYLAKLLESKGYKLFNSADFTKFCDDKLLTYIGCTNLGFKMPKTFAAPLIYSDQLQESNFVFLNTIETELGFPLIVKRVYGSLGEGVFKVNNHAELVELYKKLFYEPILFQEYIDSSFGKSMRVMVINEKIFGAFERYNDLDFRSNFSVSASGKSVNNEKYLAFAKKIAEKLHILYAGIDLLFGKNDEPILCEINSNAFFEVFEEVTKLNVAKAFLEMIKRHIDE